MLITIQIMHSVKRCINTPCSCNVWFTLFGSKPVTISSRAWTLSSWAVCVPICRLHVLWCKYVQLRSAVTSVWENTIKHWACSDQLHHQRIHASILHIQKQQPIWNVGSETVITENPSWKSRSNKCYCGLQIQNDLEVDLRTSFNFETWFSSAFTSSTASHWRSVGEVPWL